MLRDILLALFIILLPIEVFSGERAFTVSGTSMSPALVSGDTVIVDDGGRSVEKDDLVAIGFKHTSNPIVKRVMAVDGDKVEIKGNAIFINDKRLRDISENRWASTVKQLERYNWIVPPKNVFILGDNPKNSRDSRRLGLISTSQITGKVVRVIKKEDSK